MSHDPDPTADSFVTGIVEWKTKLSNKKSLVTEVCSANLVNSALLAHNYAATIFINTCRENARPFRLHQQKQFHLMYYIHISLYRLVIPPPLIPPIPPVVISCSKSP